MLAAMDNELETLESKVAALLVRITELSTQNERLAGALALALKENAELNFRIEESKQRLSSLIARLPAAEDGA